MKIKHEIDMKTDMDIAVGADVDPYIVMDMYFDTDMDMDMDVEHGCGQKPGMYMDM
jgi:hypothetical protein